MNRVLYLLLIGFIASCSISHMDKYPGKSIPQFPVSVQGEYRLSPSGIRSFFQGKNLDSARVRVLATMTETLGPDGWAADFVIDSNNILSQIDNYYFLSKRDVAEPKYWNTTLVWCNEKELFIAGINETDKNLVNDKLKNYLTLNLLVRKNNQEKIIKIAPTDKVMLKAISNISTDSKDSVLYFQVNDAQLLKFIKKEVSPRNALRFIRIKPEIVSK